MQTQENDLWFGNPTPFLGTPSPGPRISPRLSWWMLVLGHLLQLHRTFPSICLTSWSKRHHQASAFWSGGGCHQDVAEPAPLRSLLTMEMSDVFLAFQDFQDPPNQPGKSLAASATRPQPFIWWPFPLPSCWHRAGVPGDGCQLPQPLHATRLVVLKRFPSVLQPEGGLRRPDKWSSLLTPSQLCLLAFPWLCSLS